MKHQQFLCQNMKKRYNYLIGLQSEALTFQEKYVFLHIKVQKSEADVQF